MSEFHCVMTIQSFNNWEPSGALTRAVVLNARDTQQAYDLMYLATMEAWRVENSHIRMGQPVVMHWSCSPLASTSATTSETTVESGAETTSATAAEPTEGRYGGEDGTSVDPEALAAWLVEKGFAEERRGYGHIDGETLAEALLSRFTITKRG